MKADATIYYPLTGALTSNAPSKVYSMYVCTHTHLKLTVILTRLVNPCLSIEENPPIMHQLDLSTLNFAYHPDYFFIFMDI